MVQGAKIAIAEARFALKPSANACRRGESPDASTACPVPLAKGVLFCLFDCLVTPEGKSSMHKGNIQNKPSEEKNLLWHLHTFYVFFFPVSLSPLLLRAATPVQGLHIHRKRVGMSCHSNNEKHLSFCML